MANKVLNWGLLSTANINNALIPPLRVSERNHLLAIASLTQQAADAYAREKKISRAYGSYESLLADPEIDVIYNPLPNHLHAEWTIKAVEAGKHVLCEKPLALNAANWTALSTPASPGGRTLRKPPASWAPYFSTAAWAVAAPVSASASAAQRAIPRRPRTVCRAISRCPNPSTRRSAAECAEIKALRPSGRATSSRR